MDHWLIFGWIGIPIVLCGPAQFKALDGYTRFYSDLFWLRDLLDFLNTHLLLALTPAILFWVVSVYKWIKAEEKSSQFQNLARIAQFVGIQLFALSFLIFDPIHVIYAGGFHHAIEYMFFVGVFQKRKFNGTPEQGFPRWAQQPVRLFGILLFCTILAYCLPRLLVSQLGGKHPVTSWGGASLLFWALAYELFESIWHFSTDTFLWRMRSTEVRKGI